MNVNGSDVDVILGNKSDFCVAVTFENENGSYVGMILGNVSDFYVGVILVNGNDPGVDVSPIDWIPLHTDFPHYHPSFLGYLGPFFGTYLLPPIPNLSPIYATTLLPNLFPQIVHAPRCLILFDVFDMTPL